VVDVRRAALAAAVVLGLAPAAARAQDRFEIQVYDVETAPRGETGIEVHANHAIVDGAPDEAHLTFEPHLGLAPWAELGGYFQTAIDTAGDGGYAGVKLRMKLRWPRRVWDDQIGLALNGEVSAVPSRYEPAVWGSELRPVIDLQLGRLYASVNPILGVDLRGALAGRPQLEPAAKVAIRIDDAIAVGVEGYAALGPIDDLGSERVTRVLAAVDVRGSWWDLNAGAGPAWGSPDRAVVKIIVGFHPRP
jgi:hypothetical protein